MDLTEGWVSVKQSKTGNPVKVPFGKKLNSIFESIKLRPIDKGELMFPGIKSKAVSTAFKRACVKAGFEWASFHSTRHFCGSYLSNNEVRMELIAEVLGHKDLRSTQVYVHFRKETVKKAVEVFDKDEVIVSPNCRQMKKDS